jgi:cyclomaltodextrinase
LFWLSKSALTIVEDLFILFSVEGLPNPRNFMRKPNQLTVCLFIIFRVVPGFAANQITVPFRFYPAGQVIRAFVPGTFNNWGPNSNGLIAENAPSRMEWSEPLQCYIKLIPIDGNTAVQYKFHTHPGNNWITDPLNPNINTADNNNSVLNVRNGYFFQIVPGSQRMITDSDAAITAGACFAENDSLLTSESVIRVDGHLMSDFSGFWFDSLRILQVPLSGLDNGTHTIAFDTSTRDGLSFTDSVVLQINISSVYFLTPDQEAFASPRTVRWHVNLGGAELDSVVLLNLNGSRESFSPMPDTDYQTQCDLIHGLNQFVVRVREKNGTRYLSDTLSLDFPEPRIPEPGIELAMKNGSLFLSAIPNDPQNQTVSCAWSNGSMNPVLLTDLEGRTETALPIAVPDDPGDYRIRLMVTDPEGYHQSTQTFFSVRQDGSVIIPESQTVPQWVKDAVIYSVFIRSFTEGGTLLDAIERLPTLRDMGFNVLWVLPVMDVEGVLDQNYNIGYSIVDFYNVEPVYGSNQDFKTFVSAAHEQGLRVILDVTPNHTSHLHPFAEDIRLNGITSRYWDFYQHEFIPHNSYGMEQSLSTEGFVYYSGFTSNLLNWNWSDAEARQYMLDVYQYWLREYDIDGFRLDVYWGPHGRYGQDGFDRPLRAALKSAKSDILILGETGGTGGGTEDQYADRGGGMDMGYDWNLFWTIHPFPSISALHEKLVNAGYRPGENSFFFRFLENHDEIRVANRYNDFYRTIPVSAAVFLSTGIPMLYQGQEVGMGFQMTGSKEYLARSTVNWNYFPRDVLTLHYQKLAQIRSQFPQFRRQYENTNGDSQINSWDQPVQIRLNTSSTTVYAYGRPWPDENGIVILNFSGQAAEVDVDLDPASWMEWISIPYVDVDRIAASNLYSGTVEWIPTDAETLHISLEPYGVAVYVLSLDEKTVNLPNLPVRIDPVSDRSRPANFVLHPNHPNPFNPVTVIRYEVPESAAVLVEILNILGNRIQCWSPGIQSPGDYQITWNGCDASGIQQSSGLYILQIQWKNQVYRHKMMLIR